jgi:ABC-type multidrug transport system ATPase subunit
MLEIPVRQANHAPLVSIKDCAFRYRGATDVVFSKLTLDVGARERVAIIGPNGSGKSTLLQLLLGSTQMGEITGTLSRLVRSRDLAFVGDFRLSEDLQGIPFGYRVDQLLRVQSELLGRNLDDGIGELAQRLNIDSFRRRDTSELSSGQRKRLQLYMALSKRPSLLFADEPLENVDVDRAGILGPLRHYLTTHGIALLLVTHRREEAEQLCERICLFGAGGFIPVTFSALRMSVQAAPEAHTSPNRLEWLVEGPATAGSRLTAILDAGLATRFDVTLTSCGPEKTDTV